jgi:hypothetical protein
VTSHLYCVYPDPNLSVKTNLARRSKKAEAEFKEKHGVWDPMPELSITSPYVQSSQSRLQHIYHGQRYARVNVMSYARDITIPKYAEQNEGRILKGSLLKLLRDSKI